MVDMEKVGEYIVRLLKTDDLIKQLAKAQVPWTDRDLDIASEKCQTLHFTQGDILFQRKLLTDPEHQGLCRALDVHIQTMKQLDPSERLAYWDRWAKPITERKNQIELEIRYLTPDLEFYKIKTATDYNEEYEKLYGKDC